MTEASRVARLNGKRVLVTGAARGLGREICRAFARHGARVAFTWSKSEAAATELVEELRAAGADVRAAKVSALDADATRAFVRGVGDAWGGIDVLVNNAGISQNLPLALLDEQDFDAVVDLNLKGAYMTAREVLRGMIRQKRGVVLNVGSLAGVRMIEAPIHYCASKKGLVGMTEAMAKEVARHGVRVLCIAPGLLEDGVGRNLPEHRLADYLKHNSLGRVGTFREVAELAAFLVSDQNGYMTGATVLVDGGM
jgi:NAD(P)-dependent dehydrogenase (short-subunit alcohol dehydrogenase family)